jgi:hypothetical protein
MSAEVATAVELLQQLAVLHIFTLASEGTWFSHELQTKECNGIKKKLKAHAMRKCHSIPVCPFHQMDQPLFNVVVPEARRRIDQKCG